MTLKFLTTPVPGLFFSRRAPDADRFFSAGDQVVAGAVVAVVEVMKSYQEVTADHAGRFVRYLVEDDQMVMPGDPICEIEE